MINCVDTTTNTCVFGHGGILVHALYLYSSTITFKGIKPPQNVGAMVIDGDGNKVGEWEYTGESIPLTFKTINEVLSLEDMLKDVEERKINTFTFKGINFDFTKYDQVSMDIVKRAVRVVGRNLMLAVAC